MYISFNLLTHIHFWISCKQHITVCFKEFNILFYGWVFGESLIDLLICNSSYSQEITLENLCQGFNLKPHSQIPQTHCCLQDTSSLGPSCFFFLNKYERPHSAQITKAFLRRNRVQIIGFTCLHPDILNQKPMLRLHTPKMGLQEELD